MTFPKIYKRDAVVVNRPNESSPIVLNGELYIVSFPREGMTPSGYEIRNYRTNQLLATKPWPGMFGCAIVVNGIVHIFGTTGGSGLGNSVIHSSLDVDWNPTTPTAVWSANPACDRVWNTSVCATPNGFAMVLETQYNGIIFLSATAIAGPWAPTGGLFNHATDGGPATFYSACPTIKYVNGAYIMFYLRGKNSSGQQDTVVARSTTLATGAWQVSPTTVLTPLPAEGINNSDFDFVEFEGRTYGVYFDGDQATWLNTRTCLYDGSMLQFVSEFFP